LSSSPRMQVVTVSHRVRIPIGPTGEGVQLAEKLRQGDFVICGRDAATKLLDARHFRKRTAVWEFCFKDDASVWAYPHSSKPLVAKGVKPLLAENTTTQRLEPAPQQTSVSRHRSLSPSAQPLPHAQSHGWSDGTRKHNSDNPRACEICWHFHRKGHCELGTSCDKCHAPHGELPKRVRSQVKH